jgi:glycosyltransferase involved in cell wall biosynthesis
VRVAYTFEQCWHRVPGGTGISAIEVAKELSLIEGLDLYGVAGRHRRPPTEGFIPPVKVAALPFGGPILYEMWTRLRWPKVESVIEDLQLVHATTIIPPATDLPLVATIHDLAFIRHPEFFTARGNKMFTRSLRILQDRASLILCSSMSTYRDCLYAGFEEWRLRHVPLGVTTHVITEADRKRVRTAYSLPDDFILFVGTLEPRKNLARLVEALSSMSGAPPLIVVGMEGWGEAAPLEGHDVRFTGFVPSEDLPALYNLCTVFAFPSIMEGYGLPVIEAMAHCAPVVTSRGTSTEEVAGGAAVLVDPLDLTSIASGIREALANRDAWSSRSLDRAAQVPWSETARLTFAAYSELVDES